MAERPAPKDDGSFAIAIGKEPRVFWQSIGPRHDDPPRLPGTANSANCQPRVVRAERFRTDQDRIDRCTELLRVLPRRRASNPAILAWPSRQSSIQTHSALCDYERQTDIRYGAARGWVDAIIAPHATRDVLVHALRCATRPPPKGGFRGGVMQV